MIIFNEMPRLLSIVGKYSKILVSVKKTFITVVVVLSLILGRSD